MINEVLHENEEEDEMNIEKKIDDFIASEDIASLNSGLNILDTLEMSGLVEEDQAKALKKKMADSIIANGLVLTNTQETYDFINSEEFTSSFSEDELAKYKSSLFSELVEKKNLTDVVEMVLGEDASNLDIDGYDGDPFSGMVEITGFKDQDKIDEIIERFQDISGKKITLLFLDLMSQWSSLEIERISPQTLVDYHKICLAIKQKQFLMSISAMT